MLRQVRDDKETLHLLDDVVPVRLGLGLHAMVLLVLVRIVELVLVLVLVLRVENLLEEREGCDPNRMVRRGQKVEVLVVPALALALVVVVVVLIEIAQLVREKEAGNECLQMILKGLAQTVVVLVVVLVLVDPQTMTMGMIMI